jgi:hypothetical protein
LWDTTGAVELACDIYTSNTDDVDLSYTGLVAGKTYYFSVDALSEAYDGTFKLCLEQDPDYDSFAGALDVTSLIGTCSADTAYSTLGASPDGSAGSCWNNAGPKVNRWFKFTAPSSGHIYVKVGVGGTEGSQRYTQLALWDTTGAVELACDYYTSNTDDVDLSYSGLVAGKVYYISVDAYSDAYDSTFTLCIDSALGYDFYGGAYLISDINNWCSV